MSEQMQQEPLCGLNYWIRFGQGINPCPVLRRRALRLDGSNWLIHRSKFPHAAFARLQEQAGGPANMRYWINEFAPGAQRGLLEQAAFAMMVKLRELVADLSTSIKTANEKLDAAGTRKERERQEKNREAAVKRCKKALEELKEASKSYGLPTERFQFEQVMGYARALEQSQYQQTEAIASLAQRVIGTEMETAAMADEVPTGILADFVEERGGDVTAARIAIGQIQPTVDDERRFDAAIQQADLEDSERAAVIKMERDSEQWARNNPGVMARTERADRDGLFHPEIEVTYAHLGDGSWGVRARRPLPDTGSVVTAIRSTGQRRLVRLLRMDRHLRQDGASLWTFEDWNEEQPQPTQLQDADASPAEERAEPILPEATPKQAAPKPEIVTSVLSNGKGWDLVYKINCKVATLERSFKGDVVETLTMSREQARHHYTAMEAQGYRKPGSDL